MLFWLVFLQEISVAQCSVGYAKMEQCQHVLYFMFVTISLTIVVYFLDYFGPFFLSATHFIITTIIIIITTVILAGNQK